MANTTVPTAADFDWSSITGQAVERLRAPKVEQVPAAIVALAQRSYDGVENPADPEGGKLHVLRHHFETTERAAQFAKLLRKAGAHTTPPTSVTVVVDPDQVGAEKGGDRVIAWRSGDRRGPRNPVAGTE